MKRKIITTIIVALGLSVSFSLVFAQTSLRESLKERFSGCKSQDANQKAQYGLGDEEISLQFEGRNRYYLAHLPATYDRQKPMPLILSIHGGGGNPKEQARHTGMSQVADKSGFIVVYPAGSGKLSRDKLLTWSTLASDTYADTQNIDDIGFLRAVIEDVSKRYNVDRKRVYATGMSQGAMMSYRLACELSDMIAAIGPVAGSLTECENCCDLKRPVSVIHFHGLNDTYIPYEGGKSKRGTKVLPGIPGLIKLWTKKDGLSDVPTKIEKIGNAEMKQYGPGASGAEVILWTLTDGGHTWPGGLDMLVRQGKVNCDINASELMWEFFKRHSLDN